MNQDSDILSQVEIDNLLDKINHQAADKNDLLKNKIQLSKPNTIKLNSARIGNQLKIINLSPRSIDVPDNCTNKILIGTIAGEIIEMEFESDYTVGQPRKINELIFSIIV